MCAASYRNKLLKFFAQPRRGLADRKARKTMSDEVTRSDPPPQSLTARADRAESALDGVGRPTHNRAGMEGAVIGTYRVLKKLGEGGMGAVYSAEHSLIGRRAAIKVLLPALSQNQEIVQRFFNEARAATAIQDPGIVQIFDFGYHSDGSAYIVMEYLEGEPLDARLKRLGRLAVPDALRILRMVASSLNAAHARGIIHRDLKPENIYLVSDREVSGGERPKILDFGIAKLTGDTGSSTVKTHTTAIMGTPMYMSPEQCRGAGQVDLRSDIYALGCVLFHLLVGRTPFDGDGIGEIIACHLREPAPSPSAFVPDIPPEVDQLVLRCMAKSADQRFQTAGELADVIGWFLGQGGQPMGASMPSGRYQTPGVLTPTTLSGAAGARITGSRITGAPPGMPAAQTAVTTGGGKRGLAIGAVGVLALVVGVAFFAMAKGNGDAPTAAPAAAPAELPPSTPPPAPAIDTAAADKLAADKLAAEQLAADQAAADKLAAEKLAADKLLADQAAADKLTAEAAAKDKRHRDRDKARGGKGGTAGGTGTGTAAGGTKPDPKGSGVFGDHDGDGIPDER